MNASIKTILKNFFLILKIRNRFSIQIGQRYLVNSQAVHCL